MAIEAAFHREMQTGLSTKSVHVLLKENQAVRVYEVKHVGLMTDASDAIAELVLADVWALATPLVDGLAWWFAAQKRAQRAVLINMQLNAFAVLGTGGASLSSVNAAALTAINDSSALTAEWNLIATKMASSKGSDLTDLELFLALTSFISLSRLAGL